MKNYYHLLNVPRSASAETIKAAYRKLSKRLHPDQNQGDVYFEEFFKEIQEAYAVLSDPTKRQAYNWDMDNGGGKGAAQQTARHTEQEQQLQKWFEELAQRQQTAFQQRADELKKAYQQQEARFLLAEKQLLAKMHQSRGEVRNVFVGSAIIILTLLLITGLAIFNNTSSRKQMIAERMTQRQQEKVLPLSQWNTIQKQLYQQQCWQQIATEHRNQLDPWVGLPMQRVTQMSFLRNSDTLTREARWTLEVVAEYLTTRPQPILVYLLSYANMAEPKDTASAALTSQSLADRRGMLLYQLLAENGVNPQTIRALSQIELCPQQGDSTAYRNRGRVEIFVQIPPPAQTQ